MKINKTTLNEASSLLEDVLDTLVEVGNGVTDSDLHDAADKLFEFRNEHFNAIKKLMLNVLGANSNVSVDFDVK